MQLSFSASNLRDRDVLSKSDPMVVVYQKEKDATLSEVFRSEVVLNSLAPKWIKKFIVAYHFETVQTLVFRVYDVDTKFQNSREEVIVYLLPAFSFDLMFTFLNMLILFRCLSLTNSSFLVRQHVHCLR
jgi:hypothetical protein